MKSNRTARLLKPVNRRRNRAKAKPATIIRGEAYNTQEMAAKGFGCVLLKKMRKEGVRPLEIGCSNWYLGDEVLNWMSQQRGENNESDI